MLRAYVCFALGLFAAPVSFAQQPAPAAAPGAIAAPAPAPLLRARTIFIANAGSDAGLFPHPFSGAPDRPYQHFYAAMAKAGMYKLVDSPAEADLVAELRLTAPSGPPSGNKQRGDSDPLPMLRLAIYDRPTHYVVWAVAESVDPANLQRTHDHNLDTALDQLLTDFQQATGAAH